MTKRKIVMVFGLLTALAISWPLVVAFVVHPWVANRDLNRPAASASDLQLLLNVRRYEVHIPEDKDNWTLGLTGVVDGNEQGGGGGSVPAGARVVLLIQQTNEPRLRYCWHHGSTVMDGTIANPLENSGVSMTRGESSCEPGDWLIRGGRHSVSGSQPADFEVRVTLSPPFSGGDKSVQEIMVDATRLEHSTKDD